MCVCVCKYTQPYFQSGTAWSPLCAFPCSHRGMCTVYPFSPYHSLKTWDFSSLGSCLLPSTVSPAPIHNHFACWVDVFQPCLQRQPCPMVPAVPCSVSLVPCRAVPGVGQGLWLCSWAMRSCSTVGRPDPALRWSESCIWGHLDTTVQGRRLGADSAAG